MSDIMELVSCYCFSSVLVASEYFLNEHFLSVHFVLFAVFTHRWRCTHDSMYHHI